VVVVVVVEEEVVVVVTLRLSSNPYLPDSAARRVRACRQRALAGAPGGCRLLGATPPW